MNNSTLCPIIATQLSHLELEYKEVGAELVIKECPFCHPHGDKSDNLWKLNLNPEKGVYHCHRCSARGKTKQFFDKIQNRVWCRKIWSDSVSANQDEALPLRLYLKNRGLPSDSRLESIRFHKTLKYEKELRFPALVARVSDLTGQLTGVQRIFLTEQGTKAPVDPAKKSLGSVIGAAVQLDPAGDTLAVAEGIETALAVRQITKIPTWAAVSAPGLERLIVPDTVKVVRIFADFDPNGRGQKAAEILAARLHGEGKKVFVHLPKSGPDGRH